MAVTLYVPREVVSQAMGEWDDAGDTLDGAWHRLASASSADLSPDVAAAFDAFQTEWSDEIKSCGRRAQRCSEELAEAFISFTELDEAEAERVRAMLPWVYRAAAIVEV